MKEIIRKQDDQILKAQKLIESKDSSIEKCQEASRAKDKLIQNKDFQCSQEIEIRDAEIKRQTELREMDNKFYKKDTRKSFWKGFTAGGFTVAVVGGATLLYVLSR